MTIGDCIYQIVCGFLILTIVCLSLFGIASLWNTEYVTEGIIVSMGYQPETLIDNNYYWIDVYNNESKSVRRIKVEGLNEYQVGNFWRAAEP